MEPAKTFKKRKTVSIEARIAQVVAKVQKNADVNIYEFTHDAAELAKQLLRDATSREIESLGTGERERLSTGTLVESILVEPLYKGGYAITTNAPNQDGHGYGAAQEYGWHPKGGGQKKKGKFFLLRGTLGMAKRWMRGKRWQTEGPPIERLRNSKGHFVKKAGS